MKKLRILLADDHALVRRGARALLQAHSGWRVVGEAVDGDEAVQMAIALKPDVAIVDISMPEFDGIEATRRIREAVPDTKVLVLTLHESDAMVRHALDAGARGYVLKSDLSDCLVKAVKSVSEGKRFLTPNVSEIVLKGFLKARDVDEHGKHADARLTRREIQVIRLLAEGKTNKEIAVLLAIAVRTVETHRSKIMLKLGLHSLADLIHYAMRNEIISKHWAS
jgi:DNA-binding NarL/FixJ family response regulator